MRYFAATAGTGSAVRTLSSTQGRFLRSMAGIMVSVYNFDIT